MESSYLSLSSKSYDYALEGGTDQGELIICYSHIGHFVLVDTLMPILKATAASHGSDTRVVIVSEVYTVLDAFTRLIT